MEILNKFIKFITTSGDNKIHEADSSIFDRIRIDFFNKDFCYFLPVELFEYKLMQFESCCSNAFSEEGYKSFVSVASINSEEVRPKSQFEYYLELSLSVLKDLLILKFLYKNDYVSKLQSVEKKYLYVDEFGDIEIGEVFKKLTKFANRHFYSLTTGLIDDLPDYIINSAKTTTNNPFDFEHVDAELISHDLSSCIGDVNDSTKHLSNIEMDITDPYEYEEYIAQCLISLGWHAHSTKGSGDQGADVLAEKNGIKVVIQCKLYGQPVGNKAVQEVYSAKGFYECDVAIVVTNSSFTKSAMQLSSSLDVHLVHDSELAHFFLKYDQSDSNESEYLTEEHDTFDGFPANETNFVEDVTEELLGFGWDVGYDEDDIIDIYGNFNKLIVASKNGTRLLGKCIHYEKDEVNISEVKDFCEFFTRHREEYNNDLGIFVLKNNVSKKLIEEFNKLDNIEDIYLISLNSISNINDIVA